MSDIDMALTSQLVVAWAGESGEDHRLGWWRCDLASEYGGEDLFRLLLPSTLRWAALQGARDGWHPEDFWDWVAGHGEAGGTASPVGRRLGGSTPATVGHQVCRLVAGLAPAAESYPLPHFRRAL